MELLVAITVIAVLAGLLLTALSQAKAKGQGIACLNNVRQVVLARQMYPDNNAGKLVLNVAFNGAERTRLDSGGWIRGWLEVLLDEHPDSINDGGWAFQMYDPDQRAQANLIDMPASYPFNHGGTREADPSVWGEFLWNSCALTVPRMGAPRRRSLAQRTQDEQQSDRVKPRRHLPGFPAQQLHRDGRNEAYADPTGNALGHRNQQQRQEGGNPLVSGVQVHVAHQAHHEKPDTTSAGAVATAGTAPMTGAKNMAERNRPATTTDTKPVLPPALTPAALSM